MLLEWYLSLESTLKSTVLRQMLHAAKGYDEKSWYCVTGISQYLVWQVAGIVFGATYLEDKLGSVSSHRKHGMRTFFGRHLVNELWLWLS